MTLLNHNGDLHYGMWPFGPTNAVEKADTGGPRNAGRHQEERVSSETLVEKSRARRHEPLPSGMDIVDDREHFAR